MITVPGELAVTLRAQGNSSLHTIQQRPIILVWEASCCVFDPISFQACCRLRVFWSTLAPGLKVHQPQFARHFSLWSTPTTNDQGNIKSQEGSHLERSGHVRGKARGVTASVTYTTLHNTCCACVLLFFFLCSATNGPPLQCVPSGQQTA